VASSIQVTKVAINKLSRQTSIHSYNKVNQSRKGGNSNEEKKQNNKQINKANITINIRTNQQTNKQWH
jgi:ribosomal protein S4